MTDERPTTIDDLNVALEAAELVLRDLRLGVAGQVAMPGTTAMALAFLKNGGQWGLYVSANDMIPLLKASREARILAAHALPALLTALRAAAQDVAQKVKEATEAAHVFVADVEAGATK